jgi:hypothetical protein
MEEDVATLPLLSFDEAQTVGEQMHDRWQRLTGAEAPFPRDSLGWADLVQWVTRKACERVVERASNDDETR